MNSKNIQGPWGFGANFIPSNAVNQLEMWQAETFSPDVIDRELAWAEGIGMTLMRVYLHDLAYASDPAGFLNRVEQYLEIADRHHIRTIFVFFDDCWLPNPAPGPQPEPKPFTHNSGWVQSPGESVLSHPRKFARLKEYMQAVLRHFKGDARILMWDLYNEPRPFPRLADEGSEESPRHPLLGKAFEWAREVSPSQPLTVDIWSWRPLYEYENSLALKQSDVVSFHCYCEPENLMLQLDVLRFLAKGRPLICTEYLARTRGSTFQGCLPILHDNGVSAINWGLVAGKTNTIYPWNWNKESGTPSQWFHDVFKPDGTLLYPEERQVFKKVRASK